MNTITLKNLKTKTPRTFKIIESFGTTPKCYEMLGVVARFTVTTPRGKEKFLQINEYGRAKLIGYGVKTEEYEVQDDSFKNVSNFK